MNPIQLKINQMVKFTFTLMMYDFKAILIRHITEKYCSINNCYVKLVYTKHDAK